MTNTTMSTYTLFSWGANSQGQLGQSNKSETCDLPCPVSLEECSLKAQDIKKIVGGAGHTLILDKHGRVYSCGWNDKGQTGHKENTNILYFRQVRELDNHVIVDIACGWDSSAALTDSGVLFVWGSNKYGQLGQENLKCTSTPCIVNTDVKLKGVSMGLRHTAVISNAGNLYVTGANSKNQLGLDSCKKQYASFHKVTDVCNIEDVSCGQNHTVLITMEGNVIAFGDNKYGQLGKCPSNKEDTAKHKIGHFTAGSTVHTGWTHTAVLDEGQIYSWGRNTYCQLGRGLNLSHDVWIPQQILNISKISQLAAGSEHSIALSVDGKIFSWGWNEHANCGNIEWGDNVPFPREISFPHNSIGILVGSGAGHSFAVIKQETK